MGNIYERKSSTPIARCMDALKYIPVLFIGALIVWSYYAYVIQLCLFAIDNVSQKVIYIIFFHLIGFLFLWSYWKTIFTPVARVPTNWRVPETELERLTRVDQEHQKRILANFSRNLPVTNRTLNGSVRFCEKCKIIKPDRAHHCSVCGCCVLKMDHHCPWVNNCVNFKNYKFFVLFLGYGLLYCLYNAATSLEYFIQFWRGELNGGMGRFHILFLFFVSLMFALSLVSLFMYHIYLVLYNRTTLEAFRAPIFHIGGPDKNGYNLGKYANFQEIFGDNWKLWWLPIFSSLGDGLSFETQTQHLQSSISYDSMGDTQNRLEVQPTDKLITNHHIHHIASHNQQINHEDSVNIGHNQISPMIKSTPKDVTVSAPAHHVIDIISDQLRDPSTNGVADRNVTIDKNSSESRINTTAHVRVI